MALPPSWRNACITPSLDPLSYRATSRASREISARLSPMSLVREVYPARKGMMEPWRSFSAPERSPAPIFPSSSDTMARSWLP